MSELLLLATTYEILDIALCENKHREDNIQDDKNGS